MFRRTSMNEAPQTAFQPKPAIIGLVFAAITALSITAVSPLAMLVVLRDGAPALAICVCGTGLGLWIIRSVGLDDAPLRWRLLLSCTVGIGTLSLLMLALGLCGVLQRGVWLCILLAGLVAGAARLKSLRKHEDAEREPDDTSGWLRLLWLLAVPFAVLALLGATMPPGILWPAEGNGYDVLEYHLGAPREYLENGGVTYLPHNIYSNFPFSVEMLYLLSMVLHGDALAGVFTAQLLNVALAFLAIGGVWLAGREFGPRAGIVAGVSAASVPIITYLSAVAYVENGMLAFTAMATAAAIRAFREAPEARWRWCLAAGLCAGFACGCKYTALPMVALPLMIAMLWLALRGGRRALLCPLVFCSAAMVTFGPWLAKNVAYTGNPVFPLARDVFHERAGIWDDERAAHWYDGHLPAPEDRPLLRRMSRLWHEVLGAGLLGPEFENRRGVPDGHALLGSALYGPGPLLALMGGVATILPVRRRRASAACGGVGVAWISLAVALVAWTCFTHMAGRFAIPITVPVALILGGTIGQVCNKRRLIAACVTVILGMVAWNFSTIYRIFTPAETPYLSIDTFGRIDVMLSGNSPHIAALNERLRDGNHILIVADARRLYLEPGADYCVVFNRNPFADAAATMSPGQLIDWLRDQGYGYIYVDWVEMWRLRASRYGFWPSITVDLLERLVDQGLAIEENFYTLGLSKPYATLFRVPGR